MKIVIFGLTITSAWGNGHATTFRSLVKALARRGHKVVFIEKDVEWYRSHRDLPNPEFCAVELYDDWPRFEASFLEQCRDADAIMVGSYFPDGVVATKALIEAGCGPLVFYDIDTPITLTGLRSSGSTEYLDAASIPLYDAYLSFSGGPALLELERRFGAKRALAFYCSVDPDLYRPTEGPSEFSCDLSYLGTYSSDRQPKLMQWLGQSASRLPEQRFMVAGAMYPEDTLWPPNVARLAHVPPPKHPAFYSSARFTLNLTRGDMVAAGYSPSVRLFEAAACGATILSDDWQGLDEFLSPGQQVLLPRDEHDVIDILLNLSDAERGKIGRSARERILAEHTSAHRAAQFEDIISRIGATSGTGPQTIEGTDQGGPPTTARGNTPLYTPQ